ncbi:hypothetical protein H6788_02135 [Candidatus Nomurabacteria bacterium]|nr:hypothetical protein [Candidatus Nomurabacteria bacterium]MCB9819153.1 hypothetical protein [Candidatus Nomurabacteria bacterium]
MNAITAINQIKYRSEHLLLAVLFCTLCVLAGLYFYFLSVSVIHVVINEELNEEMNKVQGEIAGLEAVFMEKQHNLSIDLATSHGYIATGKKIFIDRSNTSVVTQR